MLSTCCRLAGIEAHWKLYTVFTLTLTAAISGCPSACGGPRAGGRAVALFISLRTSVSSTLSGAIALIKNREEGGTTQKGRD